MRISPSLVKVLFQAIESLGLWRPKLVSGPNRLATEPHSQRSAVLTKLPQNTVIGCNDRAVADLLKATSSTDRDERKSLRRSANRWSQRANMLDRLAKSFLKRTQLDEASRQYQRDRAGERNSASRQRSPSDD